MRGTTDRNDRKKELCWGNEKLTGRPQASTGGFQTHL